MELHQLTQGTPQWHAHRLTHFNASDAPAMMGCSAYKTRSQLLHEMHTGIVPEVDAATQRRFDDGHRFEELARAYAEEEIINDELYPIVGTLQKLSMSSDGMTMGYKINFEHKSLNKELRECMESEDEAARLPLQYRVQMEQQMLVAGVCEKTLFMASKWDSEDQLMEERHCWYYPDYQLRQQIIDGWIQFESDLANYTPTEAVAEPVGRAPETLPALHIEVTGMVTASNLAEFKAHALAVFGSINRDLVTDAQFADAEKTVGWCKTVEQRLAAAKQHALSQTASIDLLFKTIDDISAEARATRLELDRLVKDRKETIRAEIVADGRNAMADHINALNERLGRVLMPPVPVDFAGAIKGKKNFENMRDAVSTELARKKIEANAVADRITVNLRKLDENPHLYFLFSDSAQLLLKAPDDLAAIVQNRIAAHEAKEAARIEAERARIEAEERAKAQAAERIRADAEIAAATAKARAEAHAQAAADAAAKRASDEAIARAKAEVSLSAPIDKEEQPLAHVTIAQVAINNVAHLDGKDNETSPPNLKLGQICARFGIDGQSLQLTAAFLSALGFEPAATDRASKLYHEEDFQAIGQSIIKHISGVLGLQSTSNMVASDKAGISARIASHNKAIAELEQQLEDIDSSLENNVYASHDDAEGYITERYQEIATTACDGRYCMGASQYKQKYQIQGNPSIFEAVVSFEYNRHDKTYYYIDDTDYSYSVFEELQQA